MDPVKQIYLLLICQGFYLGSLCQRWTFPTEIPAVIGSCVEIPCTYHPVRISGASSTVWYLYNSSGYTEILNTKNSSSVMKEYKGRTSLVSGNNSCTLRIDPVRREDGGKYYYPGIAEDRNINAYDRPRRFVRINAIAEEEFRLSVSEVMTEGEASVVRCYIEHTCRSGRPSLQLNKPGKVKKKSVEMSGGTWREESELTYIPSYMDDGTPVHCTATHPNGRKSKRSKTLNINYAPKNITVSVIGMDEVIEGSNLTLRCNSFSKPDVHEYEWYKGNNKTKLPDGGREITVRNVTRDMEPYSCAAINRVGRGESPLTEIHVLYAATGVHIIVENEREFTKLLCDFLSSRPNVTHYTWMKDGSIVENETEKTLTIYNNEEGYGQYSCIAHNRVGNFSSEEIYHKGDTMDLCQILGIAAGIFLLLFLILLIYIFARKKCLKLTVNENETSPEATYTDLVKRDIETDYEQIKNDTSPDATYTELVKRDIENDYEQLKFGNSIRVTNPEEHVDAAHDYENIIFK